MSTGGAETLQLERAFSGTPEEVFDAWTNPEVLRRWWAAHPNGSSPGCDVDLRVGGRYVLRMQDPDTGQVRAVGGEYREIDRPRLLVYTWAWEDSASIDTGHVSVVTVSFEPSGEGRTTVRVEHSGLPSEPSRAGHLKGWKGTLDNLAARIFTTNQPPSGGPSR